MIMACNPGAVGAMVARPTPDRKVEGSIPFGVTARVVLDVVVV